MPCALTCLPLRACGSRTDKTEHRLSSWWCHAWRRNPLAQLVSFVQHGASNGEHREQIVSSHVTVSTKGRCFQKPWDEGRSDHTAGIQVQAGPLRRARRCHCCCLQKVLHLRLGLYSMIQGHQQANNVVPIHLFNLKGKICDVDINHTLFIFQRRNLLHYFFHSFHTFLYQQKLATVRYTFLLCMDVRMDVHGCIQLSGG